MKMAPVTTSVVPKVADLDVIHNRISVALAKRERLIKSWMASSARPRPPPKSQQELDTEDADLFNPSPAGLGLGAPVPKEYLDGDVKRKDISTNDKLKRLLLGDRAAQQASKPRDTRETSAGAKRILGEESSDEDQGRSALGKAKKSKNGDILDVTSVPCKDDGDRIEIKQVVKVTSHQSVQDGFSHVVRSETRSHGGANKKTDILLENTSLQPAKPQTIGKLMPLVDYDSDDGSDQRYSGPVSTISQKSPSSIPKPSGNETNNVGRNCPENSWSDTIKNYPPATSSIADHISCQQNSAELEAQPTWGGVAYTEKPSSKSSSSYNSKGRSPSTESDPSDMETVIPLSLTLDVAARTMLHAANSAISQSEARRVKNRNKRARRRERDRQQKMIAPGIVGDGIDELEIVSADVAQKPSNGLTNAARKSTVGLGTSFGKTTIALADVPSVAKKIKDRLLDANGN